MEGGTYTGLSPSLSVSPFAANGALYQKLHKLRSFILNIQTHERFKERQNTTYANVWGSPLYQATKCHLNS